MNKPEFKALTKTNDRDQVSDIIKKRKLSWNLIKEYLKTKQGKKQVLTVLIFIIVLSSALGVAYNRYLKPENSQGYGGKGILPGVSYDQTKETRQIISKLDGQLHPENVANRHPLAVVIENHPDARPQTGLDQASIVYEAIAEGGITRFLAVFGPNSPEKVGPVRSARTFFLDWNLEYDAFFAHCGGNIDALDLIPQIGIKDLDQFRYGTKAFWREPETGKAIEHTMYTDTTKLYEIAQDNGWNIDQSDYTGVEFKEDLNKDQRLAKQNIIIDFSSESYKVKWIYDPETNQYNREMAGSPHQDAITGQGLKTKNIIIQEVKRSPTVTRINENGWDMTTIGEGKAKVFLDGKTIEATWKKENRNARTLFYDINGKKVSFNPGVFWYEIVPPETSVSVE